MVKLEKMKKVPQEFSKHNNEEGVGEYMEKVHKIYKWMNGEKAPPHEVSIAVSDKCNLNCKFCDFGTRTRSNLIGNELSEKRILSIIKDAAHIGVKRVAIAGGGEPFFYPKKMMNILKSIMKHKMEGAVCTNGTLLTKEMIKTLVEIKLPCIIFSIDGPDAETHDYLRSEKNTFDKCVNAVKYIQSVKKKLNSEWPSIIVSTVLVNKNYNNLDKMIDLFSELKINSWQLQALQNIEVLPNNKSLQLTLPETKVFKKKIKSLINRLKKLNIENNLSDFMDEDVIIKSSQMEDVYLQNATLSSENEFLSSLCFMPWLTLKIHSSGHLDFCEHNTGKCHIGNRSLEDVWFYDKYLNELREKILKKRLPNFCSSCCTVIFSENQKIIKGLRNLKK